MSTPRTDKIAHAGLDAAQFICLMTDLSRQLETELALMTERCGQINELKVIIATRNLQLDRANADIAQLKQFLSGVGQ